MGGYCHHWLRMAERVRVMPCRHVLATRDKRHGEDGRAEDQEARQYAKMSLPSEYTQ